jgi:hypothetical protein
MDSLTRPWKSEIWGGRPNIGGANEVGDLMTGCIPLKIGWAVGRIRNDELFACKSACPGTFDVMVQMPVLPSTTGHTSPEHSNE